MPMASGRGLRFFGASLAIAGVAVAGMLVSSPRGRADDRDDDDRDASKIEQGFDIAPVPLNLEGKNRKLVGLGSYIVNAQADCNGCHSTGPAAEFAPGGNPYFLHTTKEKINPATYLGGGRDFGLVSGPPSPHIISRNLTPSTKTESPEGDHTLAEFLEILRTGKDFDHLHPNCSISITTNCFPPNPPFNGDLLQIMPWPIHKNMSDHDIRAIYEYLKAIPCIQGNYPSLSGLAQGIPPEPADRCK
ncbi:MAG TPA: hypothetical protein VH140_05615 [Candidatus Acidoferrum sp.]|jgi:hypothetical protein|nr:hypothetical protein [Candidatus Acidoferrum sp.]